MSRASRWITVFILICGCIGSSAGAQQRADEERVRRQLIGTYKLISYYTYDQNGVETKQNYSVGQIAYDAAGRMSAQLMRADRPQAGRGASDAERAAALSGYIAYFGHYTIDAEKGIVYHHVEGSITQNMLGQAMPRYFSFSPDGASLFLQTRNGDRVTGKLQWDRYK
jgi:lipocalin-like protein